MKITRANYEQYFLDHFDQTLSVDDQRELFLFLQQNPDLRHEFEQFDNVKLEPPASISLSTKGNLKNIAKQFKLPEGINDFNEWCIAALEGDLNDSEKHRFDQLINSRPTLKREYELCCATKLNFDKNIVVDFKNELKRREAKIIPLYYYVSAVAAAIFIVIGLFLYLSPKEGPYQLEVASAEKQRVQVVTPSVKMDSVKPIYSSAQEKSAKYVSVVSLKVQTTQSFDSLVTPKKENDTPLNKQETSIVSSEIPDSIFQDPVYATVKPVQTYLIEEEEEESQEPEELKEPSSKGWKAARFLVNGFNKISGKPVELKTTQQSNKLNYELAVGKFELSGTKGVSGN